MVAACASLACAALFYWVMGAPWSSSDLPPRVTAQSILAIQPGMTRDEVQAILGMPVATRATGPTTEEWLYSRDVPRVRSFPRIKIRFESQIVDGVLAHRMDLWGVDPDLFFVRNKDGTREFHGGLDSLL